MPRILFALFLSLVVSAGATAGTAYRRVLVWLDGEPLAETHARALPPLAGLHRPLRMEDPGLQTQRTRLRAFRGETLQRLQQFGFVADGETDVVLHALVQLADGPNFNYDVANWKTWLATQKRAQSLNARRD